MTITMITAVDGWQELTVDTVAVVIVFVVCGADSASLSGKDLEDKRLHDEGYHDFKDYQRGEVEAEEVYSSKPVFLNLRCKSFLRK